MKKFNTKGFTLIELLAVITIMGILMLVAIPTISRTIENTRKDMFIDTAKKYAKSIETMWVSDNLECQIEKNNYTIASAVPEGNYYVKIYSNETYSMPLEQGGKSPWGNRHIKGFIIIRVEEKTKGKETSFYPVLLDDVHGVNVQEVIRWSNMQDDGKAAEFALDWNKFIAYEDLGRKDLTMSGAEYTLISSAAGLVVFSPLFIDAEERYACREV